MRYILYLFTCLSLFYASSAFSAYVVASNFGSTKDIACQNFGKSWFRNSFKNYLVEGDICKVSILDISQRPFDEGNYVSQTISFFPDSSCKASQEEIGIRVHSVYYDSVCYKGCVYSSAPKSGCVNVDIEGTDVTCGFVQTASSCDAQDGTYTTGKDSEADKKKKEEADQKQKELDNTYCKTGTYNAKDPYYTKCPNRDGSGRLKDPSKDGNGNPLSDSSKPSSDGSASTPTSSSSDGSASDPNSNSNNSNSNSDKDDSNNNVDLSPLNATLPTQDLSNSIMSKLNLDMFKTSGSCPSRSYTLTLYSVSKTFNIDYKKFCDVLEILGYIVAVAGCLHAVETVVRDV